jgi:hypothetical protein
MDRPGRDGILAAFDALEAPSLEAPKSRLLMPLGFGIAILAVSTA